MVKERKKKMNNFEINKVKEILTKELYWTQIDKDEYDEPILKNQFGCICNGGVGISEEGNLCGECNMKVPCYHLIYNSCYSFLFESEEF